MNKQFEYPRDFKGVWIPKEVYLDERLNAVEKILFAEICSLDVDESDGCYASNEYLSKFCQCSTRKVSDGISKLIKYGYIYVYRNDGRRRYLKVGKPKSDNSIEKSAFETSKNCESGKQKMRESNIDNNIDNIDVDIYASCPGQSVKQASPSPLYIDKDSFTKEELHRHLVRRMKKFFPDSENNKGSIVELTKIIEYFYAKYEEELGEKHPILSDMALDNITVRYLYPSGVLDTYSVYEFDDYKDLIDKYFTVDYGKYRNENSPYQGEIALSLSHFMSDNIRENLFRNVTGIPY